MADTWFVGRAGERSGPFTTQSLRDMAADGRLAPTDLVWREGMSAWAPAASVPGLFASSRSASSPNDNPYAPPAPVTDGSAPIPGDSVALGLASRPYSFSAAFELAVHTLKRRWGTLLYIGLILFLVAVAVNIPQMAVMLAALALGGKPNGAGGEFLGLVLQLVGLGTSLLVGGPFFAGVMLTAANATLGRSQRGDLVLGFRRWGNVVVANLLVLLISIGGSIFVVLPIVVPAAVMAAVAPRNQAPGPVALVLFLAGLAASLSLLVVFTICMIRIFFTPVIAADPELGLNAIAALRCSWSRVSMRRGCSLLGLLVVSGLLLMVSFVLFCVGFPLLGLPFYLAILGSAYQLLFRNDRDAPSVR